MMLVVSIHNKKEAVQQGYFVVTLALKMLIYDK